MVAVAQPGLKKGRFDYNSTLKHVHVFGHSHLNVDQEIEGSRWYQRAVGYPTDRGPMPPEMPRQDLSRLIFASRGCVMMVGSELYKNIFFSS